MFSLMLNVASEADMMCFVLREKLFFPCLNFPPIPAHFSLCRWVKMRSDIFFMYWDKRRKNCVFVQLWSEWPEGERKMMWLHSCDCHMMQHFAVYCAADVLTFLPNLSLVAEPYLRIMTPEMMLLTFLTHSVCSW